MESFHDHQLHGYRVDSENRQIEFKLAWPVEDGNFQIKYLTFGNVQGYELKNDALVSIVFEFEELEISQFLSEYREEIKEAYRQNGAYGPWASDLLEAENTLSKLGTRAVVLSSSIGIEGWVLATNIEVKNA